MIELHKIGSIVDGLRSSVVLFNELYGSQESVAVLNRSASQSFSLIKSALLYEIVMRISSLLDPAETMGSDNLTFDRLLKRMNESVNEESEHYFLYGGDDACKEKLNSKVQILDDFKNEISNLHALYKRTGLKKYRNKLGAHIDVEYSVGNLKTKYQPKNLNVNIDFQLLSDILNKMISIIYMAGSLYNGPDKDQFLHRKADMPETAGGKQLIQKLISV